MRTIMQHSRQAAITHPAPAPGRGSPGWRDARREGDDQADHTAWQPRGLAPRPAPAAKAPRPPDPGHAAELPSTFPPLHGVRARTGTPVDGAARRPSAATMGRDDPGSQAAPDAGAAEEAVPAAEAGAEVELESAAPPKLTKKEISLTTLPCGYYKWLTAWELDKATPKGGVVVQKVNYSYSINDNKGAPYFWPKQVNDPAWYPYWEAWEIAKGQRVTNLPGYDDKFASPGSLTRTKGKSAVTAQAQFHEGARLAGTSLKATHQPPAGDLPSSKTDPKLAGGTGAIAHDLTATWDCTTKGQEKTGKTEVQTL